MAGGIACAGCAAERGIAATATGASPADIADGLSSQGAGPRDGLGTTDGAAEADIEAADNGGANGGSARAPAPGGASEASAGATDTPLWVPDDVMTAGAAGLFTGPAPGATPVAAGAASDEAARAPGLDPARAASSAALI